MILLIIIKTQTLPGLQRPSPSARPLSDASTQAGLITNEGKASLEFVDGRAQAWDQGLAACLQRRPHLGAQEKCWPRLDHKHC